MNSITEVRYNTFHKEVDYKRPTVFLAGPTVRGHQPHLTSWRFDAIELFEKFLFEGNLIIPEFQDKKESDQFRYDIPQWEFEGLRQCHCVMFWIPRTQELIGLTTNHEHGYWMAREREKVVYGHPKDAYRMSYLDIMWVEDAKDRFGKNYDVPIYTSLSKTIIAAISLANKRC